jgi:carbamoyltransferase
MNILGLHFGHDAAACVLKDGQVASYVMRERHARIKHAISLDFRTIQAARDAAGISWDQIDHCAITSTQNIELIIDDPRFSIDLRSHPRHQAPSLIPETQAQAALRDSLGSHSLMDIFYNPAHAKSFLRHHYRNAFPEHRNRRKPEDFHRFGTARHLCAKPTLAGRHAGRAGARRISRTCWAAGSLRQGFHHPVTVRIAGHDLPGYFIAHHAAHAASNYYQSGFRQGGDPHP